MPADNQIALVEEYAAEGAHRLLHPLPACPAGSVLTARHERRLHHIRANRAAQFVQILGVQEKRSKGGTLQRGVYSHGSVNKILIRNGSDVSYNIR